MDLLENLRMSFTHFFKNLFFLQHIMMENPRLEEENIIKDIRNLSRLEKENQPINRIIRDIKNLFQHEGKYYHKPIRLSNTIIKIRPYLKGIINKLKKSDTLKTQLTIATIDNDEKRVMHSKSEHRNHD